jgi:cytochrome c biogenesis protein CcmG/thiol:disulfide interchange protein DsbE
MRHVYADSPLDVTAYRGRVLYVDFWASWCTPCRQSFPWMQSLTDTYEREGLSVVAVNLDQNRHDADKFLAQFHPNFDVRFDPQGELAARFKVQGMPSSLIIDRHGVLRYMHVGFQLMDRATYEAQLRELLAEK